MDRTNQAGLYGWIPFGGGTLSFRVRLLLSFSLLIALTFGIGGAMLISTSFHSMLKEEKNSAIKEYETIQSNVLMLLEFSEYSDYRNVSEMLRQMEEQNMARWQAISFASKGKIMYESGDTTILSANLSLQDVKTYAYVHTIDEKGARLQMYSEIVSRNETLFLRASFALSSAYEHRHKQQKLFFSIYKDIFLQPIPIRKFCYMAMKNGNKNYPKNFAECLRLLYGINKKKNYFVQGIILALSHFIIIRKKMCFYLEVK